VENLDAAGCAASGTILPLGKAPAETEQREGLSRIGQPGVRVDDGESVKGEGAKKGTRRRISRSDTALDRFRLVHDDVID
jgi:hypothetical protein